MNAAPIEHGMREDELARHIERLAQHFESHGFIVTRQLEVEAAGLAAHLGVKVKTLRNWRDQGHGPLPSRTTSTRVALYSISDFVRWRLERESHRAGRDALADDCTGSGESARQEVAQR